jgi:hypothetical protein
MSKSARAATGLPCATSVAAGSSQHHLNALIKASNSGCVRNAPRSSEFSSSLSMLAGIQEFVNKKLVRVASIEARPGCPRWR